MRAGGVHRAACPAESEWRNARNYMGDFNRDRVVDFSDFQLLSDNFTRPAPGERMALEVFAAAHVPEPGIALLGLTYCLLGAK